MDQVTLPRATVQQALHVATAAGYPVALIAALKAALEQPEARVPEHTLPMLRDKHGHMVQYPGRIVYVHDKWRLVYIGTIDGRHEFFAEEVTRINLGSLSFDAAKAAMLDLIRYNKERAL